MRPQDLYPCPPQLLLMPLTDLVLPLLTGVVAGMAFAALDLPIPAPPKLAGILGIAGIYTGFQIVSHSDAIIAAVRSVIG